MRLEISILACKLANKLSKLTKREGSVIGGAVALFLYKDVLSKIKYPETIIGITGSSGKGSTTELVAKILKENGKSVIYNKNGSNVLNAIVNLILSNTSLNGKFKGDVLLMELDERYMADSLKYFDLTHMVITNITRDQPPRNAHPEFIQEVINKAIKDNTHLILNADDPLVYSLKFKHKCKVTTYGMNKNNYSKKSELNNKDAAYCPFCNNKLQYDFYHYGHIGSYKCTSCNFKRPNPDYLATNINVEKGIIYINNNKIHLPSNFLYSVYFTTAAYAVANLCGIKEENILKVLNDEAFKPKRLNIYNFDNRKWQMLASKNENNLSYKQSLDFIVHEKNKKTVILGFDNSSRRYRENDISWIWDIDFEELNDKNIDKILLIGRFKYDMLTRMEYTGIPRKKIILVNDLKKDLFNILRTKTKGNIYSCVCFDKEIELKNLLKEEGIINAKN